MCWECKKKIIRDTVICYSEYDDDVGDYVTRHFCSYKCLHEYLGVDKAVVIKKVEK